ncbi:nucleoside ABC transporter membrane protein [Curtobacterium sp. PhB172]|uniref:ABC transporter permease n=1 Tax=unclassified Curtobacterium TaxID=257496 RepID=UPI000FC1F603|nr:MULTISPECIES: ABC transporter permease [unclassified Curtobacterium]ROQ06915.1 nucleoside ABC transporter membrane protein [Curtobacterium sp. PhB171]ROQ27842.1 nucleoside ABC transporter membrane protein [Curtobacterium sp. PhB170]ROS34770.1 nucleoside ABC transporter membrane protein [Curtobacterium sp. PhB131]ROS63833.1 nucleoside ABC transporter membrane protein [Curtobacterium sp. PhB172]ROS72862.1 nucleoside ABC transporter membrane protein [Curtobacterium sp. PhB141]
MTAQDPDNTQPTADTEADAPLTDDRLQESPETPHLMTDSADDTERRNGAPGTDRWHAAMQSILNGSVLVTVLAVVLALVACGILIALTDENVRATAGYFFARPADMLQAIGTAVGGAYSSLFQGSVVNFGATSFQQAIAPLTRSIDYAVPLVVAGLGIALSFRAGLFNIGGQGQILMGAAAAGWVGFSFDGPAAIHIPLTIVAGIVGGAVWGGIVGVLKARTGANEVVVTIMLNYVALYLVSYLLRTPGLLQAPGSSNPISPATKDSALLPQLFGERYGVDLGFIVAIIAVVVVWWLVNKSSLGFRFRTIGENPRAARVAGMSVPALTIWVMVISGALVGIAGAYQVQGAVTTGFTSGIDAGIGFDAITVALLGRSKPWGVFWAAILFGVLKNGGYAMQAANGIPIDIVGVIQALIVLFIAAPPLVRAIFRIPQPGARQRTKTSKNSKKAVAA